ncbi:NfeD family protein [Fimbriiglobus ruber]|uniref:Putative membrane-bound ClpP-class protease n=1 Tax=Fimbriiglobus ruber TaxID=1908690 RepID=A0A225DLI3_9BACT|nr:NfeD family protein [Fimbriiglobus ruber]OWK38059.1 putative membrane-bound ClpP-class protease [Fimbriiglobus ruber]
MTAVSRRLARSVGSAALLVFLLAAPAAAQNAIAQAGLFVTVPNPLTSDGFKRIENRVRAAREKPDRVPGTIVFDFNPNDRDAATTDYGSCYNLAKFIASLHDTKTVGYVHHKVSGHTVLPVLACQQIVVGPQGAVGEVAPGDQPLNETEANAYAAVALGDRPQYHAVARKMFDPAVRLRKGKKNGAAWYFDLSNRAKAEKDGVSVTDTAALPSAPDGRVGLFGADALRELGLSQGRADSRQDLLEQYGIGSSALREDPLDGRAPVAFHYVLHGQVDGGVKEAVVRLAREVVRQKGNVLFLQLECAGGDLQAARDLAEELRKIQAVRGDDGLLVVAFIPDRAPDTAAVIALGCAEIVMSKRTDAKSVGEDAAPEAEFGDFDTPVGKAIGPNVEFWVASLRELAEAQGYPQILVDGMLKKDIEIVRVHKKDRSVRRLMTDAEFQEDKAKGAAAEWVFEASVKPKGQYLKLTASKAEELGLARFTVDTRDPAEVYAKYGISDSSKVKEAAPAWLDKFADFLKIPAVTVLLVVIGFTGLILELKVPGTTVPGIVAALCFIMVFWAHTQFSGQVAVLAGLLFVLGLVLILLEVFVLPGFGAAGVSGIALMLAALALATVGAADGTIEWSRFGAKMAQYMIAMLGSVGLALALARYLPNIPYANRLMLVPPGDKPGAESEPSALPGAAQAAELLGAVGTSVTVLRPAGSVRIGDQFVDVVTDGSYIPAGARVQVIEVEGTRIVVKEV